jgi:hypothetical protein
VAIVMGLDQHRAQITADWLDTASGEVSRARVAPADRAGVRRFLERFGGRELEVALEATTGWRFVVEELRRVGATVHLAEPAETAARRGNKKRAKNDRADARHLRELFRLLVESGCRACTRRAMSSRVARPFSVGRPSRWSRTGRAGSGQGSRSPSRHAPESA